MKGLNDEGKREVTLYIYDDSTVQKLTGNKIERYLGNYDFHGFVQRELGGKMKFENLPEGGADERSEGGNS